MTPERWQRIKRIFDLAIGISESERPAFLSKVCEGDVTLRREVESLIVAHEKDGSFIDSPAYAKDADLSSNRPQLEPGQVIGKYEVRSILGKGGMGEVYLAYDESLARDVALKLLPAAFMNDPERLRRFEQEALAVSALNHPYIITIHEIRKTASTAMIVIEFVKGESLRQRLDAGAIAIRGALEIAVQVAEALATAHAAGIMHRDIKPENIMVRPDGFVKVLDFGLAKLIEPRSAASFAEAPTKRVKTGAGVIGTIGYMSPEQERGQDIDARSDVFSLGVVIYEMATSRKPFEGETPGDVFAAVLKTEAPPVTSFVPDAPAELVRILTKALRKDPEERYQGVKDLLLDLKSLKEELAFQARVSNQTPTNPEVPQSNAQDSIENAGAAVLPKELRRLNDSDGAVTRLNPAKSKTEGGGSGITPNDRPLFKRFIFVAVSLVLLVSVAYGLFAYLTGRKEAPIDSIAVLPFENEANDQEIDYLSDGITESVINTLSRLPNLRVLPRSTVFYYKSKSLDPQTIGEKLGVRSVLTGRLVQRGGVLIIQTDLIDINKKAEIWGQQYQRPVANLLVLQTEIANTIADRLRLRLTAADQHQLNSRFTEDNEAYQLYLKGNHFAERRTKADLDRAVECYQQAIAKDGNYAMAYSALSEAYGLQGVPSAERGPRSKNAAVTALRLEPNLAEANTALAYALYRFDWNWKEAETLFQRAVDIDPRNANALMRFGEMLSFEGRHDEALPKLRRAVELEPLSLVINRVYGSALMAAGNLDDAITQLKKTVELDVNVPASHGALAKAFEVKGLYAEAMSEYANWNELQGNVDRARTLHDEFSKNGWQGVLQESLRRLQERAQSGPVNSFSIALAEAKLGHREAAFSWLEKSYQAREIDLVGLKIEVGFKSMLNDQRYLDLMRRVGLTDSSSS